MLVIILYRAFCYCGIDLPVSVIGHALQWNFLKFPPDGAISSVSHFRPWREQRQRRGHFLVVRCTVVSFRPWCALRYRILTKRQAEEGLLLHCRLSTYKSSRAPRWVPHMSASERLGRFVFGCRNGRPWNVVMEFGCFACGLASTLLPPVFKLSNLPRNRFPEIGKLCEISKENSAKISMGFSC